MIQLNKKIHIPTFKRSAFSLTRFATVVVDINNQSGLSPVRIAMLYLFKCQMRKRLITKMKSAKREDSEIIERDESEKFNIVLIVKSSSIFRKLFYRTLMSSLNRKTLVTQFNLSRTPYVYRIATLWRFTSLSGTSVF